MAKRKAEADHFVANKRQIVAAQMHARWAPSSSHGQQFHEPFCDPNYLFRQSLDPAPQRASSENPFKNTSMYGRQFKHEQASII